MLTLLIDGDAVSHLFAHHAADGQQAADRAVRHVRNLCRDLSAGRAVVCFSDASRRYFRHDLYPAYKPKTTPRPPEVDAARAGLEMVYTCRSVPGLEGDDVMGILATWEGMEGERVIVASDKDLLTVPGLHYNPRAAARSVVAVSERDADYNHLRQTLTGDTCDGYPGCPGIGPEKVKRVLWGEPRQWWGQVVMAFKARGLTETDALLQARLARICRAEDYDLEARRGIPWTPAVYEPAAALMLRAMQAGAGGAL